MTGRLRTWAYHALASRWEHHADRWLAETMNAETAAAFDAAYARYMDCRKRATACLIQAKRSGGR